MEIFTNGNKSISSHIVLGAWMGWDGDAIYILTVSRDFHHEYVHFFISLPTEKL